MKFGIFYEHQLPRPWNEDSEYRLLHESLEQIELADRLGYHYAWEVEHHFLEEYSHCSNPEVLYGAIAAKTENIRLGYGVRLMPKPYNHPVRTAESVAVLDIISGGRVDLGTGRSSTRAELEGFGVDPHATRQMWQEAIGHVVGCWTNEFYEFEGEHWSMPRRRVQPKPIQQPHPPIVIGGGGRKRTPALAAWFAAEYNTGFVDLATTAARLPPALSPPTASRAGSMPISAACAAIQVVAA